VRSKKVKIGSILSIQTGFQIRKKIPLDIKGNYKLIQVKNISESTLHYMKPKKLDKIYLSKDSKFMDKYILKKEDILYLSKFYFKAFRYIGNLENILPMSHFYILRPSIPINLDYLCWILNQSSMSRHVQGSLLSFISKKALGNVEIPLPNEETQKKIAQILSLRAEEIEIQKKIEQKNHINQILTRIL